MVLFIAVMHDQPLSKLILLLIVNSLYLMYVTVVRPFNSLLGNVRLLILECGFELLMIMDLAVGSVNEYSLTLEVLLVVIVCATLLCNLIIIFIQIIQANEAWLRGRLRPWMMHYRSKKKYALENR